MENKFSQEVLEKEIKKNESKAKKLLEDQDKMERFLQRLENKLKKIPAVGKKLSNVPVMISLVRSYIKKEYVDIPIGSIIAIVGALIYFFSPVDLIPDSIPILGYCDDALVIGIAWKLVESDVIEYQKWQFENGKTGGFNEN